jgi:hypothetical protein
MHTLNNNYKRNIAILKKNLKRGMSVEVANHAITGMELQFRSNNIFNDDEKQYINTMRAIVIEHFTHIKVTV